MVENQVQVGEGLHLRDRGVEFGELSEAVEHIDEVLGTAVPKEPRHES